LIKRAQFLLTILKKAKQQNIPGAGTNKLTGGADWAMPIEGKRSVGAAEGLEAADPFCCRTFT